MKTLYIDPGIRISWRQPTQYRRSVSFTVYPKSFVIRLGWLDVEFEQYDCRMTSRGIERRPRGVVL